MKQIVSETQIDLTNAAPGSETVQRIPFYFGPAGDSLFGWYHQPKAAEPRQTGVVICPPIGHEYVHSHRSLRHLADHLAAAGFPTLRFDYHGSGDSSGLNQDPGRVGAWLESIRQAVAALKEQSGCKDIGLLGLRMGATFAGMIAAEIDVSQLVLWEPCVQGRRFVRELKALHLTAATVAINNNPDNTDIESAGFVITGQTADDLGKINLKEVFPSSAHVLICERDDAVDDFSLRDAWAEKGVQVEYCRLGGYADMMAETHFTVVPTSAIQQIISWLSGNSEIQTQNHKAAIAAAGQQRQTNMARRSYVPEVHDTQDISEEIIQFGEKQELFGIVSKPLTQVWRQHPTILLLNSGSVHHIGPHRLYVFLARQFAQMGFRCLRMDFAGLGDSIIDDVVHENHPYTKTATRDTAAAIAALKQDQHDASFVLMGLCSGAYASFHASIDITAEQIVECVLINPLTFYWKEGMSLAIPSEAHYRQWNDYMISLRKWDKWLKLLKGGVSISEIVNTVAERIQILISVKVKALKKKFSGKKPEQTTQRDLNEDLNKIAILNRHISFVFSDRDPGYDLLMTNAKSAVNKLKKQDALSLQVVSNADHTFSKNAARSVVMDRLTSLLETRYLGKMKATA